MRTVHAVVAHGVVAHVLHVAAPAQPRAGQLIGNRLHRRRVDAARAHGLPVRPHDAREDVLEARHAVALRVGIGRLAGDHRDVVAEADVRGAVVLAQQLTLGGQRLDEVCRGRGRPEALVVVLVLQHDHEDVLDGRQVVCAGGHA